LQKSIALAFGLWLVEFIMAMLGRARERKVQKKWNSYSYLLGSPATYALASVNDSRRGKGGGVSGYRRAKGLTLLAEEGAV